MDGSSGPLLIVILLAFLVCVAMPYSMATRRGRSGIGWVLISLFISPFLAIIALLVLGDARR